MSSTIIEPVAQKIADVITGLALVPTFKGYRWEPGMQGITTPCGIVGLPTIDRTPLAEAEPELGTRAWQLAYPVELLIDLDNVQRRSRQIAEAVEALIVAVDTDVLQVQDPSIWDARVTPAAPVEYVDRQRPLLGYVVTVELIKLV